jgi:uncharacterized protein YkwD
MKILLLFLLPVYLLSLVSFTPVKENHTAIFISPLSEFSPMWDDTKYLKCNTAGNSKYLTAAESEVIYILNLARANPELFANTVIKKYPATHSTYFTSLLNEMKKLKPIGLLFPDSLCYAGAFCHAVNAGAEGYVGHTRSNDDCNKKWYYNGECCDYGNNKPLDIIMSLLIDEGVSSLGHRKICLSSYNKIGVSIQPHKLYRFNTVLDFHY